MIGNKIADKTASKASPKDVSVSNKKPIKELSNNDDDEDMEITTHKKRYISPEERQQCIKSTI